jgi:hypothetical protein
VPDNIFLLGNVPHEWLFSKVSCVVHHGGAGTTAAGIRTGKPTVIVPFFGDQVFWGSMIAKAGAGPQPISYKILTAVNLAAAIQSTLDPRVQNNAVELGRRIYKERGCEAGAAVFHQCLGLDDLRCDIEPSRTAVWRLRRSNLRLSAFAAAVLVNSGKLKYKDLKLYVYLRNVENALRIATADCSRYRPREYDNLESGPWDPISGTLYSVFNMVGNMTMGFADIPIEILRARRRKLQSLSSTSVSSHESSSKSHSNVPPDEAEPNFNANVTFRTFEGTTTSMNISNRSDEAHRNEPECKDAILDEPNQIPWEVAPPPPPPPSSHCAPSPAPESPKSPQANHSALGALDVSSAVALGISKGLGRIMLAGFKSPFEVTLHVARGFHNLPRLYGDKTVRPPHKITGVWSGLQAAGKVSW